MSEPILKCPACRTPLGVEAVLDQCSVSWLPQRWLGFECPHCKDGAYIEFRGSRVSMGDLDGAPGPCFIPTATVEAPDLRASASGNAVTVAYNGRKWRVPARM